MVINFDINAFILGLSQGLGACFLTAMVAWLIGQVFKFFSSVA